MKRKMTFKRKSKKRIIRNRIIFVLGILSLVSTIIYGGKILTDKISGYFNKLEEYENTIASLKQDVTNVTKEMTVYKNLYEGSESDILSAKQQMQVAQQESEGLRTKVSQLEEVIALSSQNDIETIINRGGDGSTKDLTTTTILSVDEMNQWIAERTPEGSPFLGKGELFLSIAKQYGIDVKYLFAHAALESAYGTSNIAMDKNNFFGIGAYNDSPYSSAYSYSSFEDGLRAGAEFIKKNYFDEGQNTLSSMIYGKKAYCVEDDGTPSQKWIDKIIAIISH